MPIYFNYIYGKGQRPFVLTTKPFYLYIFSGNNKRIGDVQYEYLGDIDIGSLFSGNFRVERVVSLEEGISEL